MCDNSATMNYYNYKVKYRNSIHNKNKVQSYIKETIPKNDGTFALPYMNNKIKGRYIKIIKKQSIKENLPVIRPILKSNYHENI